MSETERLTNLELPRGCADSAALAEMMGPADSTECADWWDRAACGKIKIE